MVQSEPGQPAVCADNCLINPFSTDVESAGGDYISEGHWGSSDLVECFAPFSG